ncbi:MAG: radical SAM protein [Clostridiales bacterium]|jgi:pyruvate formate lyase activating enzyme|nr:radical SAM protein [Clostridiales bacterium]
MPGKNLSETQKIEKEPGLLRLHSVESLAALDGEGLRTVLFMQGCPARCFYCHNYDSISTDGGASYSVEEIFRKILRFRPYYGDKGGVTFSGGEPCLQAAALLPLAEMLRDKGINMTLDTAGSVLNSDVRRLLSYTNAVLLDIKMPTDALYRDKTGIERRAVYRFLDVCLKTGAAVTVRYVAVPGVNDDAESIKSVINSLPEDVTAFEILGFHKMGEQKYADAGIPCPTADIPALSDRHLAELQSLADKFMTERNPALFRKR